MFIGGIRNNPQDVAEILELPDLVYPLFGMCIGVPDQEPAMRPRLPLSAVHHSEVYSDKHYSLNIKKYDNIMNQYYRNRSGENQRDSVWSKEMHDRMQKNRLRHHLFEFLTSRGFSFK